MKIALFAAALALATIGCKKEDKTAATGSGAAGAAGAGDCSKVTAAVDAMIGGGPMAGAAVDVAPKLKQIMLTRCTEDKWPQTVIDCYANDAKDMGGMKKCREGLAPELSQKLVNEIRTTMSSAAGGMMPQGHSGGGGMAGSAGSATGSAGSAGTVGSGDGRDLKAGTKQ